MPEFYFETKTIFMIQVINGFRGKTYCGVKEFHKRRKPVAYQLRFMKSIPLSFWLKRTAVSLVPLLLEPHWFSPTSEPSPKDIHRVRTALSQGLSGFLIKPSQCDTNAGCDKGLKQAYENTNSFVDETELSESQFNRYIFRKEENLSSALEKMSRALFNEFPKSVGKKEKIEAVLKFILDPHLFENAECFHRDVCLHCYNQNMSEDFVEVQSTDSQTIHSEAVS